MPPAPAPARPQKREIPAFPAAEELAVGFQPVAQTSPADAALFRAFQSNLLSLISHELRTPLMGVLNPLGILDSDAGTAAGISQKDFIAMAHRNAQALHRTLMTLLDLAAIESGSFHARLRELDLVRLVSASIQTGPRLRLNEPGRKCVVLGDPQKLARALEVCAGIVAMRLASDSAAELRLSPRAVEFLFDLSAESEKDWDKDWLHGAAGFQGGVGSPNSVFGGVVQSEQAFLTRMREGLGSEFILVHQIMKQHNGKFTQQRDGRNVRLSLEFPEISHEEGLSAILVSRAYEVSHGLGTVALVLLKVPEGEDVEAFRDRMISKLFRSTDAVYAMPRERELALIMDECKVEDARGVINRLQKTLGARFHFGLAHCPADGMDPRELLPKAEQRLRDAIAADAGSSGEPGRP